VDAGDTDEPIDEERVMQRWTDERRSESKDIKLTIYLKITKHSVEEDGANWYHLLCRDRVLKNLDFSRKSYSRIDTSKEAEGSGNGWKRLIVHIEWVTYKNKHGY